MIKLSSAFNENGYEDGHRKSHHPSKVIMYTGNVRGREWKKRQHNTKFLKAFTHDDMTINDERLFK